MCIYRYIRTSLRPIGPPGLLHGGGGALGVNLPDPLGHLVVRNGASLRSICLPGFNSKSVEVDWGMYGATHLLGT